MIATELQLKSQFSCNSSGGRAAFSRNQMPGRRYDIKTNFHKLIVKTALELEKDVQSFFLRFFQNIFLGTPCHVGASFISLAPTFFKSQSALMLLLLLSKPKPPLRWASIWFLLMKTAGFVLPRAPGSIDRFKQNLSTFLFPIMYGLYL